MGKYGMLSVPAGLYAALGQQVNEADPGVNDV